MWLTQHSGAFEFESMFWHLFTRPLVDGHSFEQIYFNFMQCTYIYATHLPPVDTHKRSAQLFRKRFSRCKPPPFYSWPFHICLWNAFHPLGHTKEFRNNFSLPNGQGIKRAFRQKNHWLLHCLRKFMSEIGLIFSSNIRVINGPRVMASKAITS